jgi:iron-sulfur cluster repair protein YtfE (RIC family)
MEKKMINKTTTIEDLIEEIPGAITYLMDQKIRCIRCGEPIWGTLEEAAKEKDYSDEQIDVFVKELNQLKG